MTIEIAEAVACVIEAYGLAGIAFAIAFLPRGIVRMDEHLRDSPIAVRLLIAPGIAALWPLFAWRWIAGRPAPIERNAHRDKAARRRQ